jgi:hypothetical protein
MSKALAPLGELTQKNECIRVCIRVRPLSKDETQQGHTTVVEVTLKGEIFVAKPYV